MRTLTIIMIFSAITSIFAQDFEPEQVRFNWGEGGPLVHLSSDMEYFQQRQFMLGWHWGASKKITTSLLVRQNDGGKKTYIRELDTNYDVLIKPEGYSHAVGAEILNARAMQYEPTLKLDPDEPEKLVIREGDMTRPVFGFLYRRGLIPTNPQDPNFNRLIINTDSMSALTNQVILDNPWPQNALTMFGCSLYEGEEEAKRRIKDEYLCRTLFISINLRRLDASSGNEPVLKIELPYTRHNAPGGYIQFQAIPSPNTLDTFELARGCMRDTIPAAPNIREIIITKNMIPPNNKDITISAFFRCNGQIQRHNPELQGDEPFKLNKESGKIDSLGIRITYLGNAPIAIDWVRIETPHARRLLWGAYDQSIINDVQERLNKFLSDSATSRNIRLFRFNTIIEGSMFNWIAEKYFNNLVGNIGTCEVGPIFPAHYEYYVNGKK